MTPHDRQLLTISAAARYLGISARALRRLLAAGDLAGTPTDGDMCVTRAALDAYLETSRVQPGDLRHLYGQAPAPG